MSENKIYWRDVDEFKDIIVRIPTKAGDTYKLGSGKEIYWNSTDSDEAVTHLEHIIEGQKFRADRKVKIKDIISRMDNMQSMFNRDYDKMKAFVKNGSYLTAKKWAESHRDSISYLISDLQRLL